MNKFRLTVTYVHEGALVSLAYTLEAATFREAEDEALERASIYQERTNCWADGSVHVHQLHETEEVL